MKKITILTIFVLLNNIMSAQQTIYSSISHDGLEREYILYIPTSYTGGSEVPLLFNFHGYSSNAFEQMVYGDFRSIADTATFLIVHPLGTKLNGITHWNVGGWTTESTVDDVGFISALLDTLQSNYHINADRVYSTGMSNGGYMSFLLACQLSHRIAAIASVTGSMTPETYNDCNPQHPTPILQIHGTSDPTVPYYGSSWTKSIDDVLEYWVDYNNCNSNPEITSLPDIDATDGSTVEKYVYHSGDKQVNTEHYKIIGGAHTWPGTAYVSAGTNYDIDASLEVWNFLSRYDINGLINTTTNKETKMLALVNIYPNPTQNSITVSKTNKLPVNYTIYSIIGEKIMDGKILSNQQQIDLSHLTSNMYFLKIENQSYKILKQ